MEGANASDDDLFSLMPKSVKGMNASGSTESDLQPLKEYLDLQKQKAQQEGQSALAVAQEIFLPSYNRRRDRLVNRRQGSGRPTTARSFGFAGRKTAVEPSGAGNTLPPGQAPATAKAVPVDENLPPWELLPSASKQRKTEREERKRKGTGRAASIRSFGLDLKQLSRQADESDSETEWAKREGQLAAARSAQRKKRQESMQESVGGQTESQKRRVSLAGRRKSMSQSRLQAKRASLADSKAGVNSAGGKEKARSRGDAMVADALATETAGHTSENKRSGALLQQGAVETGPPGGSNEQAMTDGGMDMEIDGSDEEVDGPMKAAETGAGKPADSALWSFNPLFGGGGSDEAAKVQQPNPTNSITGSASEAPQIAPLPVKPSTGPQAQIQTRDTFDHPPSTPTPAAGSSPAKSHAASNAVRETPPSRGVGKSASLETHSMEARAAEALAGMNLVGGPEMAAGGHPPDEEEMDFPALEGSPPPMGPVETSEGDGSSGQDPLALAVVARNVNRHVAKTRPPKGASDKKNKRLMLLHGRKSLANAGLRTEQGVRRTTRARVRPLEFWRNETVVYERSHDSLPTIARVITMSPDPIWPRPEGRLAIRQPQKQLAELDKAEEILALSLK